MTTPAKILVVDDTPQNVKLLADLLAVKGYAVVTASSGAQALEKVGKEQPDLVLLDVVMPEMSGYEVCRQIRDNPVTAMLPVVMVTALDPMQERVKGIDAGADDFLTKPINRAELLARVRSLLRIKQLHDELTEWNRTLEQRVQAQVGQLERLARLKRFFSPQLAEMIVSGDAEDPLKSHRREVTVVFLDLRGFTSFAETSEPEEVMGVLREYHAEMGRLILEHEGTLERFTGDGMMIFFNDPVPVPDAPERAVRMAVAMRQRVDELLVRWKKRGYDLDFGVGIAQGSSRSRSLAGSRSRASRSPCSPSTSSVSGHDRACRKLGRRTCGATVSLSARASHSAYSPRRSPPRRNRRGKFLESATLAGATVRCTMNFVESYVTSATQSVRISWSNTGGTKDDWIRRESRWTSPSGSRRRSSW